MSTDYSVHCRECDRDAHLGVRSGVTLWFGHGSRDEDGRKAVGEFIQAHAGHELVVCLSDFVPRTSTRIQPEDCERHHDEDFCIVCGVLCEAGEVCPVCNATSYPRGPLTPPPDTP